MLKEWKDPVRSQCLNENIQFYHYYNKDKVHSSIASNKLKCISSVQNTHDIITTVVTNKGILFSAIIKILKLLLLSLPRVMLHYFVSPCKHLLWRPEQIHHVLLNLVNIEHEKHLMSENILAKTIKLCSLLIIVKWYM